eukprot:scaffold609_cov170-Amphora_coffeaeformis.AAC.34
MIVVGVVVRVTLSSSSPYVDAIVKNTTANLRKLIVRTRVTRLGRWQGISHRNSTMLWYSKLPGYCNEKP